MMFPRSVLCLVLLFYALYLQVPTMGMGEEGMEQALPLCNFETVVRGKWVHGGVGSQWGQCTDDQSCAASLPWYQYMGDLQARMKVYGLWVKEHGAMKFEPEGCVMTHPSAGNFVRLLRNRKLVLIGDSVGEDHYRSLLMFLGDYLKNIEEEQRYTRYQFPGISREAAGNCAVPCDEVGCFVLCFVEIRANKARVLAPAGAFRFATDVMGLREDDVLLMSPGLHYHPQKMQNVNYTFGDVIEQAIDEIKATSSPPLTLFREVSPQLFRDGRYNPNTERSRSACCVKPPMSALEWEGRSSYDWANPDLEDALRGEVPMLKIFAATMAANGTDMKKGRCQEPEDTFRICLKTDCFNKDCFAQDGTHFIPGGHTYEFWTEALHNILAKRLSPMAGTSRDMHDEAVAMVDGLGMVEGYKSEGLLFNMVFPKRGSRVFVKAILGTGRGSVHWKKTGRRPAIFAREKPKGTRRVNRGRTKRVRK